MHDVTFNVTTMILICNFLIFSKEIYKVNGV
jgi:hypothetical protein